MNWKRGLLLAGLNLVATLPMIALIEARDAHYVHMREQHSAVTTVHMELSAQQQTISFDPCQMLMEYPAQVQAVQLGNLPAFALTGWRLECRSRWTLSGWLLGVADRVPTRKDLGAQRLVDAGLCGLIVVQWLLVGGMPLTRRRKSRREMREPGSFITTCNLVATALALIPPIEGLARLPAMLACFAWLWLLALLIWEGALFIWRTGMRLRKPAPA